MKNPMMSCLRALPILLAAAMALPAEAQVKRTFTNMSFESPDLETAGCRVYIPQQFVQGWDTDHQNYQSENAGGCTVPPGFVHNQVQGRILELWRGPRNNSSGGAVSGRQGAQFAELNAQYASRIFQNVCLIQDEQIRYRFSHRGRQSASTRDVMTMHVGQGGGTQVITVGTTNNGTINTPVAHQGSFETPAPFGTTGWVDYGGTFTYMQGSGNTNIGFEAVSAAGGATSGNFLDEIQVELAPFVDFPQVSSSTPENATQNLPALRINGTIAAPIQVRVRIEGGSAVLGTDFEFQPGASVVDGDTVLIDIPAGTYDWTANGQFPLPIQVIDNDVVDGNRDVQFAILPAPGAEYLLASSSSCGGAVNTGWNYTIVDDDATVVVVKSLESVTQVDGDPSRHDVVYRITVRNPHAGNAATYSLFDRPDMDPDVTIESARSRRNAEDEIVLAPPGGSAAEWTLADARELPADGEDAYLLSMRIAIGRGGTTANDACSGPGTGLYNLVAASVPAEDDELTSSACSPTPTPVWVTLDKQLEARAVPGDQFEVRIYAAGIDQAQARTSGSAEPATVGTGVRVFPAGDLIAFAEVVAPNGDFAGGATHSPDRYAVQIACSNAATGSPTVLPAGSGVDEGNRQFWQGFSTSGGDDIECTITNRVPEADLAIVKTADPGEVVSGEEVVYTLLVSNGGPDAADGAIVRDPAVDGMTCTAVECGGATGGAVCPAVSVAALQSSDGVAIMTFPADSSLTISLTCTAD